MIDSKTPNLLRLYLNPHVAQACLLLSETTRRIWPGAEADQQVFLANSRDEALSGAVKLARYSRNADGLASAGLILDERGELSHFARTELPDSAVQYLPGVDVFGEADGAAEELEKRATEIGFVVVAHDAWPSAENPLGRWFEGRDRGAAPLVIVWTNLEHARAADDGPAPDIVVFDESLVGRDVPFGAFVAGKSLFGHWLKKGMATFHSTTYQPNTISNLHLVERLKADAPELVEPHRDALRRIEDDLDFRSQVFADLYSPSLVKLIKTVGFRQRDLHVDGHDIVDRGRRIFDGVAGVACSVRGHNPPGYVEEIGESGDADECRTEVFRRLHELTGLEHAVPAVSGASAVENALKIGLASQHPKSHVLVLRGGFGGKTLFALTGTWKPKLRAGLDPLYPHVVYVDPFAPDAVEQLGRAFDQHPIGVIQSELVQGVGGVREISPAVIERMKQLRQEHDCLLLIDEVQTGFFRTGPFVRSTELGVEPDLLTVGKATSDMVFPFAFSMHSERVQQRLADRGCSIAQEFACRFHYDYGYRTVVNSFRRAEQEGLVDRVRDRGRLFVDRLNHHLAGCGRVREVRGYGLLIGIELDDSTLRVPALRKLLPRLCLLGMLRERQYPVLMGFCQYETNVLKFTPPLSVTEDEVEQVCRTVGAVLRRPLPALAAAGIARTLPRPFSRQE